MKQNKNPILFTYGLIKAVCRIGGYKGINEMPLSFNEEGWKIAKVKKTTFLYNVHFKSESAKVMFMLKYGVVK